MSHTVSSKCRVALVSKELVQRVVARMVDEGFAKVNKKHVDYFGKDVPDCEFAIVPTKGQAREGVGFRWVAKDGQYELVRDDMFAWASAARNRVAQYYTAESLKDSIRELGWNVNAEEKEGADLVITAGVIGGGAW